MIVLTKGKYNFFNSETAYWEIEDKCVFSCKEPSRRRLNSLKACIKEILQSADITGAVSEKDIKNISHLKDLSQREIQVLQKLADGLRPYTPQKRVMIYVTTMHL